MASGDMIAIGDIVRLRGWKPCRAKSRSNKDSSPSASWRSGFRKLSNSNDWGGLLSKEQNDDPPTGGRNRRCYEIQKLEKKIK